MWKFRTLVPVSTALVISAYLYGCGATYSGPVSTIPEEPAAETKPVVTETIPQSPPSSQVEQEETEAIQPVMPEPVTPPEPRPVQVDYDDIEFVQHRLIVYENKYNQWLDISESPISGALAEEITFRETECLNKLEAVQQGYNQLMKKMQQARSISSGSPAVAADSKEMQRLDINFLEGRCNELLALGIAGMEESESEAPPQVSYSDVQESIAADMENKNYARVILDYTKLTQDFPDRTPSLVTRLNYGKALQYTGQIEAAARHFKNMLVSGDLAIEPLTVQREIADLLLADAKVDTAKFFYNSLIQEQQTLEAEKAWAQEQLAFLNSVDPDSEDMNDYLKLLREFRSYDYRISAPRLNEMTNNFANEHAGSPFAVSALRLKSFAVQQLKAWFGRQLVKIDRLVAEKRFSEANTVLKNISSYYLPAELQAVLQRTFYDVAQAEIQEKETQQRQKEMELTSQWETAVNLLDSQKYELAISAFVSFMGTEYEKEAKMKIIEAANQAAGEMRKEAAALFIRAGKTPYLEQKKELLLESYRLLTDIVAKYPQTELLDKVEQNISILEEQINRLDPTLLDRLHQENPAEISADSLGSGSGQQQ